jgi:uncharacterized protein
MTVLETLLADCPVGWHVTDAYVGVNWVVSLICDPNGMQRAGVASSPKQIAASSRFQVGHHRLSENAGLFGRLLLSEDATEAALGLATLNALNQPSETSLTTTDAADWLSEKSTNRRVAIFGRFPFIDDEIRPHAKQVWVFEQEAQAQELAPLDAVSILPQADIVAITGSAVINHTIDSILPHIRPGSIVALLGPSTPLSEKLFGCGIDALFGVQVSNVEQVIDSVMAGDSFQKMQGLRRVSLIR